ncbi:MAG: hypothetical protein QM749_07955 [Aquabacterium sp.]
MSMKLQLEWRRLYLPDSAAGADVDRVRGLVMTLGKPADWQALSAVWQGVQLDLSWPAPAIAVSGTDGYQLWFSLAQAVPIEEAHAVLHAVRQRYLGHIAPDRVDVTHVDAGAMPGRQVQPDQWSAFVAPDLAPMFAETPWLDIPPSPDGQADLLSGLRGIKPAAWQGASTQLRERAMPDAAETPQALPSGTGANASQADPRRFLLEVMNDERVALALRIEAAKALLPYSPAR